ncbi:hypothetical protein GGF38_005241, partial [Coemansia sp. RSA 25]
TSLDVDETKAPFHDSKASNSGAYLTLIPSRSHISKTSFMIVPNSTLSRGADSSWKL